MWGEREERSIMTEEMDKPLEESGVGPTSIDVTDEQTSIGEVPLAELQEGKVQEQNREIEQTQEESRIGKRKQKRRITSYLSNISKQVEKHGNQINKITMMIQSIQKQKQAKSTKGAGVSRSSSQSIKQIQSQLSQLQKQVTRIQKDIQRIRTASILRTKTKSNSKSRSKKLSALAASTAKSRSKKSKSLKSTKIRRGRESR
jgi:archaellum component FlaC